MTVDSPAYRAAVALAKAGHKVFPLVAGGKKPLVDGGFKAATSDLAQLHGWAAEFPGCNWGWAPQASGLCVIDLDVSKDGSPSGFDSLKTLETQFGALPPTFTVRTPSGGLHLYFKGELGPSTSVLGPSIDTRGIGSYVAIAGSQIGGKPYTIENAGTAIANLPQWVPARLAQARERATLTTASDVALDLEVNIAHGVAFARGADPAIEGRHGDETTMGVAADLHKLGLSEGVILEIMAEHYNPRCLPPWARGDDEDTLEAKVRAGVAQCRKNNQVGQRAHDGADLAQAFGYPAGDAERDNPSPPPTVKAWNFADLVSRPVAPRRYVWADRIEMGGMTMLTGRGGTHKSRLAFQLCLAAENGLELLGVRTARVSTFYFSAEESLDEMALRARAMAKTLGVSRGPTLLDASDINAPLMVIDEMGRVTETPMLAALGQRLEQAERPDRLLIIDSTYDAMFFQAQSKNNETAVAGAVRILQRFAAKYRTAIVLIFHPSRSGASRGDVGHSTAWEDKSRAILFVSQNVGQDKQPIKNRFTLGMLKRSHGQLPEAVPFHFKFDVLTIDTAEERQVRDARADQLMRAVFTVMADAYDRGSPIRRREKGGPGIVGWVADAVTQQLGDEVDMAEVLACLNRLKVDGFAEYEAVVGRKGAGGWLPTEAGRVNFM